MEIPGKAVGMYNAEPSNNGGMNWLPILSAKGSVMTRKIRLRSSVVLRNRRQSRSTGRYRACVTRDSGFRDSGRRRPRMKRTISTGTSVMASKDEKPTASVFVQASGRNIRPSCASSKKTGRNENGGPDLLGGVEQNLPSFRLRHRSFRLALGELPISVLDHDDGRVHENA